MKGNKAPRTGNKVRSLAVIGIVGAALTAASCNSGTAPAVQMGQVQAKITDAPSDSLSSAVIWVSRVYLQGGADTASADTSGAVDLFNDPSNPKQYDLLTLQNSVTADLTGADTVDVGAYSMLRLVVDSARVTLASGLTFADGSTTATLTVPSGEETGIKVLLKGPIVVGGGSTTTIVVDFNVDQNFVIQRNLSGTISQVLFTPVLEEQSRTQS